MGVVHSLRVQACWQFGVPFRCYLPLMLLRPRYAIVNRIHQVLFLTNFAAFLVFEGSRLERSRAAGSAEAAIAADVASRTSPLLNSAP